MRRNRDDDSDSDSDLELLLPRKRHNTSNKVYDVYSKATPCKVQSTVCRLGGDKHFDLKMKVENEVSKKEITMEQVYELELAIGDYIWFYEHIKIRDSMEDDTEDKINMVNKIYQKYEKLQDMDYIKLEKLKQSGNADVSIVKKILDSHHSDYVKTLVYKKYKLFCENNNTYSDEYSKCIEWIDTVLDIPTGNSGGSPTLNATNKYKTVNATLDKLHNFLTKKIYGLNEVKEKIMETMCCKVLNSADTSGKIITLVGPPGVGKTSVASTIAEAMGMPFDQISFGSIQDSKILTGHSSTYVGAVPGLFTKILIKAKRLDVLVLLDEIDKITNTQDSNITSVLLHILDKSQNDRIKDIYIPEIPLDLSKIIFLCAANDITKIDPILKDRMAIINLPGYTILDKTNIAETFLVPKFTKELDFEEGEIIMSKESLKYLISNKTKEQPGMRDVERKLREFFERVALLKYSSKSLNYSFAIKNLKFPLKVTEEIIDKVLDKK